jgi:hypothetical protein
VKAFAEPAPAVFACSSRVGAVHRLNDPDPGSGFGFDPIRHLGLLRAAGRYAASVQQPQCGACPQNAEDVSVRNVRSGRRVRTGPSHPTPESSHTYAAVAALVLKPDASFAFLYRFTDAPAGDPSGEPAVSYELHAVTHAGDEVVDAGDAIDPASVRLSAHGTKLLWTSAGARRSVPLP